MTHVLAELSGLPAAVVAHPFLVLAIGAAAGLLAMLSAARKS
jgi:hypothetical protein